MSNYQIPGIPPQMTVLAAMNACLLPANVLVTGFGATPQTCKQLIAAGLLDPSRLASSLTYAGFVGAN